MYVAGAPAIVVLTVYLVTHLALPALAAASVIPLRAGTPVFVVFDQSIDSEAAQEGETLYLRVLRPVQMDGVVVIRAGEKVRAKVAEVKKAGASEAI